MAVTAPILLAVAQSGIDNDTHDFRRLVCIRHFIEHDGNRPWTGYGSAMAGGAIGPIRIVAAMTRLAQITTAPRRYEIVEAVLRHNLGGGVLPPGLVLLEGPIAKALQTSRASVQRALVALEADGLIHRFDGRGYLVGGSGEPVAPLRQDVTTFNLDIPPEIDPTQQNRASWERIYDAVESDVAACIIFGQYRLIEVELAEHFNVSRTVVRDVLGRLQERGLIRKNQSSHWIAGPLTARSIREHFSLRRILEPPALLSAAPRLDRTTLASLHARFLGAERAQGFERGDDPEVFETLLVDTCVLATPNLLLAETIRSNLLPVLAAERLLRQLGLPVERSAITEHRLVVELLLQNAVEAAAGMLTAHLREAENRTIAQMKIVAVIPEPSAIAPYLTRE
jgi:DNA-binding GntR family transcriptional regulator